MIAQKKARKVKEKRPRKNLFPSDAESIKLRRKSAELLKRLQEQGLIQIAPDRETLFGEQNTGQPPKTILNLDRARAQWKTATRARKAAEALLAADLPDLAQPHMQEAVQTALACLQILHGVAADDVNYASFASEAYGSDAELASVLFGQLSVQDEKRMPGFELQGIFNRIDKVLH